LLWGFRITLAGVWLSFFSLNGLAGELCNLRDSLNRHSDHVDLLTHHVDITKLIDMRLFSTGTSSIPPEWRPMARVFAALGDEHRQRILLLFDKGERLNVGQITAVSTLARSTVSHHLKILHEADVLCSEKIGKQVWFWINRRWLEETLGNVLDYVRQNC